MKKIYVIILSTKEEKGYNKFCHLAEDYWDIVHEDYPRMTMCETEEDMERVTKKLEENGFEVKILSEMNKGTAITMSLEEYDKFLSNTSGDVFGIANENGEWFYIVTEDAEDDSDEAVYKMLSEELCTTVVDVIVDISNHKVAIICE